MEISSISQQLASPALAGQDSKSAVNDPAQIAKVSHQFESILIRQILNESMKSMLQEGPSGQVYGYLLTDSLADKISEGGGLGLSHILQTQLGKSQK